MFIPLQWAVGQLSGNKDEKKAFPVKEFLSCLVFALVTSAVVYFLFEDKIKEAFPAIFPAEVRVRVHRGLPLTC